MKHGLYARNLGNAEGIRTHLEEAGIAVLGVKVVDLLTEGASLVPKRAVLVELAEQDVPRAVEAIEKRAPQLMEWTEDLSSLSLGFKRHQEVVEAVSEPPPADRLSSWESNPTSWSDDLFSDEEKLSKAVLSWLEASPTPNAPQIGSALERAIRAGREDLIWPLCRVFKPVVVDFLRKQGLRGHAEELVHDAFAQKAAGARQALEDVIELAWDPSPAVRRNFCLAAGRLESHTLLPCLVSLLDDPEEEVRYEASGALYGITHKDFDYDSEAPAEERALAVARWKEWLAARLGGGSWTS